MLNIRAKMLALTSELLVKHVPINRWVALSLSFNEGDITTKTY